MSPTLDIAAWLGGHWWAIALIAARSAGLAWSAPAWGTPGVDWRLRLGLVGLLTALPLAAAGAAIGLVTRAAPGLGLAGLALPARSAVGLLLVLLGLATLAATFASAWGGWFEAGGLALPP